MNLRPHPRSPRLAALLLAVIAVLSGCANQPPVPPPATPQASPAAALVNQVVRVGSANFPENRLLAEIYATGLESRGVTVKRRYSIGTREVYIPALQDGSIDLVPEYTGNLLQYFDHQATATSSAAVYQELATLPRPLRVLDQSSAQDKDGVVVTQALAAQDHLRSIADLAPLCASLAFGGPPEFQQRPYGTPGLTRNYGCTFGAFHPLDAGGPKTVAALRDGTVQAADLFTTNAALKANQFVELDDPKSNFTAQNVVPLINATTARDPRVSGVLNEISAKLDTPTLIALNARLTAAGSPDPAQVAHDWLVSVGIIHP